MARSYWREKNEDRAVIGRDDERKRIELPGIFDLGECLVETPLQSEAFGVPMVRSRVVWVQLDRALVFFFRSRPVPIISLGNHCQSGVSFRESLVELEELAARRHGPSV